MLLPSTSSRRSTLFVAGVAPLFLAFCLSAQAPPSKPSAPKPNESTDPILRGFEFRSIGPAVMMGRLDDIQGSEKDPMIMYIGFATGGLWKSTDGGNHWHSQFDNMQNESIGAIGIAPSDPNVVYVGTGEANNRQSSSIGDGVWGTTDGGKTWNSPRTREDTIDQPRSRRSDQSEDRFCRVTRPSVRSERRARAVSLTGWRQNLEEPEVHGSRYRIQRCCHRSRRTPKIVYASSFQRRRTWYGYNGGGQDSALWKSTDGGNTWTKLDGPGWPKPKDGLYGRIAISIFRANPKIIYAQVEAGASAGTGGGTLAEGGPAPPGFRPNAQEILRTRWSSRPQARPKLQQRQAIGAAITPPPNPNGSGVFRSEDGGKTWTFQSNQNQRPTYFSQIRVDPVNDKKLLVGGTPGQMSLDGGKTWKGLTGSHTDYHAFWINPKDPRVVAVGHDGGTGHQQ